MHKWETLSKITKTGLVAVVRASSVEDAERIAGACIEGGVTAIEMTFTVPRAHEVIAGLASRVSEERLLIGAGTVLDEETARIAILAGAQFIVSPSLDLETISCCRRYSIPVMPGAMTPSEVVTAWKA